ncbi:MAG: HDIG domain-containing protein [Bacteroidales bacterium]|nr:HDIG domain-containing protein [Bacteroidales bacterium]
MMSLYRFLKDKRVFLNISLVVILLTLIIPNSGKFRYEYQKGRPWLYETLVAPVDFPVLKSNSELRSERKDILSSVIPFYRYKEGKTDEQINSILAELPVEEDFKGSVLYIGKLLDYLYTKGVVDSKPDSSYTSEVLYIVKDGLPALYPVSALFSIEEARSYLLKQLYQREPQWSNQITDLLPSLITPNLFYDDIATQSFLKEQLANISPTKGVIYTGQLIVTEGEIISADTEQLLDSFKAEYEMSMGFSGSFLLLKLGHLAISTITLLIFLIMIYYLKQEILRKTNKLNFILLQFLITALVTVLVMNSGQQYLYIVPYCVIALYLVSFFPYQVVIPIYSIILIPVIFIAHSGYELYFMNLLAGSSIVYTFQFWDRGWRQFVNSIFVFIALSLTYLSFRLIEDGTLYTIESRNFIYFGWNSLLVIAAYPFLYIFEKVFGLLSNSRLRDLSDATTPLLTSLAEKAPGTFHHSLQVANLSESAAREIGAFALLARVGALYHDIGKMSNPAFYIENLPAGESNLHTGLSPEESSGIIMQHVDEGLNIARRERLPALITSFILSHHGKSQTTYFYNQYINSGGDPSAKELFTYKGELPVSREEVIVMMADAVEASSRSLKDYSRESISALVEKMVDDRISEKQLVNSEISLKEINIIKEVFKNKLRQVYHSRLTYPDRKK